ncbi:MAG: metallophosphoesterase [Planctomycetota bacterium]|nr:metallophosphoesterase [Planctomycetota bacterium]
MELPLDLSPAVISATACAAFGHLAFWVMAYNRVHGRIQRHSYVRGLSRVIIAAILVLPLCWCGYSYLKGASLLVSWSASSHPILVRGLLLVYQVTAVYVLSCGLIQRTTTPHRGRQTVVESRTIDLANPAEQSPLFPGEPPWFMRIPGNQIAHLEVIVKQLRLPRLPRALDGLTIAHISDLHFEGKLPRAYFEQVIDQTNALSADLVAITGDLVDRPECLSWIDTTLNRLTSRYGCFFVLGNHDLRLGNVTPLRQMLTRGGAIDLGVGQHRLQIHEHTIFLAGNERPWFPLSENMTAPADADFSILLSHSPDQVDWARQQGIDLMLAGHTHGGQVRFPLLGPVIAPSQSGVKYAGGTFFQPPTLLHVSRGISGLFPIRWNCPPEITHLVLKAD